MFCWVVLVWRGWSIIWHSISSKSFKVDGILALESVCEHGAQAGSVKVLKAVHRDDSQW